MNKRQLAVAVVAVLALSSSTVASAEDGGHRRMGDFGHSSLVAPIGLSAHSGILKIDTSTAVPSFVFDTSTVTPHIDFDTSTAIAHFDTSTASANSDDEPGVSAGGEGNDDFLPAGASISPLIPVNPALPPAGLTTPAVPVNPNPNANAPVTPPVAPSWISKPHAKSNDDNPDQSAQPSMNVHDSQDSQD